MSFWDLAQAGATMVAGAYGGPWAGAAVGGGLSAVRGTDPLMGAVTGAMGGMGGEGINAAASQTALKAGTTNAALNSANLAGQGITTGTNVFAPTMTGFGGAGAGTGITQGVNTGLGNVYKANLGVGKGFPSMTNPTPQFGSVRGMRAGVDFPNNTIQPTGEFPGGGGFTNTATSPYNTFDDASIAGRGGLEQIDTLSVDKYSPANNVGLRETEIGADFKPIQILLKQIDIIL